MSPPPRPRARSRSDRPVRVAVVGTHGTGKTTLVRTLIERADAAGVRVLHAPEVPRRVCELTEEPEFFRRGRNTVLRQLLLFVGHLVQEAEHHGATHEVVIADRSLLDYWVYTQHLFGEDLRAQGVHDTLRHWVREHTRTYDLVLHLPVEFAPRDDGVREADVDFQAAIAGGIDSELRAAGIESARLVGSVQARSDEAWARIEALLGK